MRDFRPKATYFFFFAAAASLIPFLSLYFESLGMSGRQIGTLVGALPFVNWLSAPLWGSWADAHQQHGLALRLAIVGALIGTVTLWIGDGFTQLFIAILIFAFFGAPIIPFVDNSVMNLLTGRKSEYSMIRFWGGVGWGIAATILAPILERAGLSWSFIGYLFFMSLLLIVVWQLPVAQAPPQHTLRAGLHQLLTNRNFLILLAVALAQGMSLGVINTYLFLHLDALGASRSLMAFSLTASTVAELLVWLVAARLLREWGMAWMLVAAMVGTIIRLFGYVWMPTPIWVLPISTLHAFTFAFFWAAGVAYADEVAPQGLSATAQTIFSGTSMGLGQALGALMGGFIYQQSGVLATFVVMGVIEMAILIVFLFLQQRELRARLAR